MFELISTGREYPPCASTEICRSSPLALNPSIPFLANIPRISLRIEHNFPAYSFSFLTENKNPSGAAIYIKFQAFLC